MSINVISNVNI